MNSTKVTLMLSTLHYYLAISSILVEFLSFKQKRAPAMSSFVNRMMSKQSTPPLLRKSIVFQSLSLECFDSSAI